MRILQLTPRISWPPTDGGRVVMLQVARTLQRLGADVEILSLNPHRQWADVEVAQEVLSPIVLNAVDINTSAHVRAVLRSFVPYLTDAPPLVARFYSRQFEEAIRARLRAENFDIIQVESPFLFPYLRAIRESSRAVVVLRSLNVEFDLWAQLAANESNVFRRLLFKEIARGLRRYEIRHLNSCDAVLPITDADAEEFRALGCVRPMHVLPGGIDLLEAEASPLPPGPFSVGFLGSLDYRPNQDSAVWIAEELRPRLDQTITLHVAGRHAPEWLRSRLQVKGVDFVGEVEDPAKFIRAMHVMIAPILSGGGMRIKILDAMSEGRAVISTALGAAGIGVTHGEDVLLAEDAPAFAATIESLMRDPARTLTIGRAGRTLVATRYSTEALTRGLLSFYEELLQSRGEDEWRAGL